MNRREKTIAVVAGSAAGLLALDSFVLSPLASRLDAAEQGVALATEDLRAADTLFRRQRRDRRDWRDVSGGFIPADGSRAEGQLLNAVPQWCREADLDLTSLKPEPGESEQGFGKVTVRATAAGDLEAVGRFLFAVRRAEIPVRVADLSLASRRPGEGELLVQIGLSTIYLPETPAEGARR